MIRKYLLVLVVAANLQSSFAQKKYNYPIPPKDSIVDVYFDIPISDPYQWMENPEDPRLVEWIESQKKLIKKRFANKEIHGS